MHVAYLTVHKYNIPIFFYKRIMSQYYDRVFYLILLHTVNKPVDVLS